MKRKVQSKNVDEQSKDRFTVFKKILSHLKRYNTTVFL